MGNERILRAVAYLEEGGADLAALEAMGLSARELEDVLEVIPWGRGIPDDLREAVEELSVARARTEAEAGLRLPVVVVAPETRGIGRLARGIVLLALLAAVMAFAIVSRAGRPDAAT